MVLPISYLFEYVCSILSLKREITTHENIQEDTHWPAVHFTIIVPLFTILHFRSHVVRSSCNSLKFLSWLLSFGETKVDELQFISFRHHDIFWLDVSMDYPLSVHMAKSSEELLGVSCSNLFWKNLVFGSCDFVKQFATSDVLHHQVNVLFINVGFVVFHYVWMVKLC